MGCSKREYWPMMIEFGYSCYHVRSMYVNKSGMRTCGVIESVILACVIMNTLKIIIFFSPIGGSLIF